MDDLRPYIAHGCLERPLVDVDRCAGELDTAQRRLALIDERIARLRELRDRLARHSDGVAAAVTESVRPEDGPRS
ncbi:hypothetical protein [Streptomyces sp. NPDC020965]|uniref:hypothetical protein n=1 Tax=Streptomyces sp. NPDC020965 TaxID=3365105 RepID=UPI0037BD756B